MTFREIFKQFKSHSYIRRKSWSEDTFVQLRSTANLIRLVNFKIGKTPKTLNNDIRLTAEDLLADNWIDIEDLMPKEPIKFKSFWKYIDTLDSYSDEWRIAMDLGSKYYKEGKNPDEYLEEIIKKVKDITKISNK